MRRSIGLLFAGLSLLAGGLGAQAPWRGAGPQPCAGPDGGIVKCPPAPRVVAVRAARLFDSRSGRLVSRPVVVIQADRITAVGADGALTIPAGARIIDLGQATLVPGLIDAHTHMFNTRTPKVTPRWRC